MVHLLYSRVIERALLIFYNYSYRLTYTICEARPLQFLVNSLLEFILACYHEAAQIASLCFHALVYKTAKASRVGVPSSLFAESTTGRSCAVKATTQEP